MTQPRPRWEAVVRYKFAIEFTQYKWIVFKVQSEPHACQLKRWLPSPFLIASFSSHRLTHFFHSTMAAVEVSTDSPVKRQGREGKGPAQTGGQQLPPPRLADALFFFALPHAQDFAKLLNETVVGNKLSSSRVNKVKDVAGRNFHVRPSHPALALCLVVQRCRLVFLLGVAGNTHTFPPLAPTACRPFDYIHTQNAPARNTIHKTILSLPL